MLINIVLIKANMAIMHKIIPFDKQDKINEGLVKIEDGSYVDMSDYYDQIGIHLEGDEEKTFRDLDQIESERATGDCFVATAVYRDKNAPQIQILRQFRDNVLKQTSWGRTFVDFYYGGAGKKTAYFVREHLPSTLPLIRKGLDYLVNKYSAQKKH